MLSNFLALISRSNKLYTRFRIISLRSCSGGGEGRGAALGARDPIYAPRNSAARTSRTKNGRQSAPRRRVTHRDKTTSKNQRQNAESRALDEMISAAYPFRASAYANARNEATASRRQEAGRPPSATAAACSRAPRRRRRRRHFARLRTQVAPAEQQRHYPIEIITRRGGRRRPPFSARRDADKAPASYECSGADGGGECSSDDSDAADAHSAVRMHYRPAGVRAPRRHRAGAPEIATPSRSHMSGGRA